MILGFVVYYIYECCWFIVDGKDVEFVVIEWVGIVWGYVY